jgi:hypothetical protein
MTRRQQEKAPTWVVERLESVEVYEDPGKLELLGYALLDRSLDWDKPVPTWTTVGDPILLTPTRATRSSAWADAHAVQYVPGEGLRYIDELAPNRKASVTPSGFNGEIAPDQSEDFRCIHCGAQMVTHYDGLTDSRWSHVYAEDDPRFLHSGNSQCVFLVEQRAVRELVELMNDVKVGLTAQTYGKQSAKVRDALARAGYFGLAQQLAGTIAKAALQDPEDAAEAIRTKIAALTLVVFRDYREDAEL